MRDPQEGVPHGKWMTHCGLVWIGSMSDEHVLNSYKTCLRHGSPKKDEILEHVQRRNLEWRLLQ
jgi:hypothetical protein